ncbi:hypothetical protein AVEN_78733-1 [Araneus ventricosus]|uniref:Uncharacterized protein n=1 Tax=Araneus ventricosus TaxID=182803 RepID=A0A4Y1ZZJ4_ARAVE|nr:hypothetical protein AVEN_78733-1 [Araneus ventricosus]
MEIPAVESATTAAIMVDDLSVSLKKETNPGCVPFFKVTNISRPQHTITFFFPANSQRLYVSMFGETRGSGHTKLTRRRITRVVVGGYTSRQKTCGIP